MPTLAVQIDDHPSVVSPLEVCDAQLRDHSDGINRSRVAARERIGSATVERHCRHFLERLAAERSGTPCPQVLGIDKHFFSRKQGYATPPKTEISTGYGTRFREFVRDMQYHVVMAEEAGLEVIRKQEQARTFFVPFRKRPTPRTDR